MKEILPRVYTWAWPSQEKTIDFNGWYVATPGNAAVVDPAPCHDDVLDEIERLGSPQAIILTNKDHTRQSERFAAASASRS